MNSFGRLNEKVEKLVEDYLTCEKFWDKFELKNMGIITIII